MEELNKNYNFFVTNKDILLKKYKNRFILIDKQKVISDFSTMLEAIQYAKKSHLIDGEYLIDFVNENTFDSKMFHTRVGFI